MAPAIFRRCAEAELAINLCIQQALEQMGVGGSQCACQGDHRGSGGGGGLLALTKSLTCSTTDGRPSVFGRCDGGGSGFNMISSYDG